MSTALDESPTLSALVEATRARLYGIANHLLCGPPDVRAMRTFLVALEAERPPAQWATAHNLMVRALSLGLEVDVESEHRALFLEAEVPLALCSCSARGERSRRPVLGPIEDRTWHLLQAAVHADQTSRALEGGDSSEATRASRADRALLSGHAGACLFDFALRLQGSSGLFYSALGAALREVIDRDLSLLELQGVRIQRWLALSVSRILRPSGEVVIESSVRCPQQAGDAVSLELCCLCGRWDGMQYGSKERPPMILCRGEV